MKKEELIERLGKKARQVEISENQFGVVKAVFYVPFFVDGSFNSIDSTIGVDFISAAGEKIGTATLNRHEYPCSYIRLSKIEIAGKKFDVEEDISYRPGKDFITFEMKAEGGVVEESEFSGMVYTLLTESYRLFKGLVKGKIGYEPVVNPSSYAWMVFRGHLDED